MAKDIDKERIMIVEDKIISGEQLAGVLGITSRRIRQLAGEGHIKKLEHGKYEYPKAVQQYCDYLRSATPSEEINAQKLKNLKTKNKLDEQRLEKRRREIADDITNDCWDIFLDILTPMKTELVRAELPGEIEKEWNGLIERALTESNKRAGERLSDAQSEATSD